MWFSANRGFLNQNINKVQLKGVVKQRGLKSVVWSPSHRYGFLILHCSGAFTSSQMIRRSAHLKTDRYTTYTYSSYPHRSTRAAYRMYAYRMRMYKGFLSIQI